MRIAQSKAEYFSRGGDAFLLSWFYSQVKNRGPWDFKQRGPQYENFGNFHYGAVGHRCRDFFANAASRGRSGTVPGGYQQR